MKDNHTHLKAVQLLAPVIVSATGNVADIDLQNFNSAELVVSLGLNTGTAASASHKVAFSLQHADDDGTGSAGVYADVAAADILGADSATFLTTDAAAKYSNIYQVGYVGGKRFVKAVYTVTGTVSVTMGMSLVKGHGLDIPAIA